MKSDSIRHQIMDSKYDVFISYSRKDYEDNGEVIPGNPISAIIDMLDSNHISYWFDKEGIYSGSKFIEVINEAILASKMLIFISSKSSNTSKWTAGEILLASDADMSILPVKIDDSGYSPKFNLVIRPLDFVDYYGNEAESLERIKNSVLKIKEDYARKQVEAEIRELAADCQVLLGQQEALVKSLVEKNLSVGNTEKVCPVCGKQIPLGDAFCGRCGWHFPLLYALGGSQIAAGDKHHLTLARANWQKVSGDAAAALERRKLEEENHQLKAALDRISEECKALTTSLSQKESELRGSTSNEASLNAQLKELHSIRIKLSEEIFDLQQKLSIYEKEQSSLKKQLDQAQDALRVARAEAESKQKEILALQKKLSASATSSSGNEAQMTFTVKGVTFTMIRVEGMGTPYYIGETQVTQALWKAVMGSNPSRFKGENHPVEGVSWDNCQEFIQQLNTMTGKKFRLPKEAEWEYAAQGGSRSHGYQYSGSNTIDEVAWYDENAFNVGSNSPNYGTHPVKAKKPNELGIYDMSGNVSEWCEDSSGSFRVIRGGGWSYAAACCRVAYRGNYTPSLRDNYLGFRLAL